MKITSDSARSKVHGLSLGWEAWIEADGCEAFKA